MDALYKDAFQCEKCGIGFMAADFIRPLGIDCWHKNYESHAGGTDLLCVGCQLTAWVDELVTILKFEDNASKIAYRIAENYAEIFVELNDYSFEPRMSIQNIKLRYCIENDCVRFVDLSCYSSSEGIQIPEELIWAKE